MGSRLSLQGILEELLGSDHVYFQPPEDLKMTYPAIVYNLDDYYTLHADNQVYHKKRKYQVTAIYRNPDDDLPDKLADLVLCNFQRQFISENLIHDVYNLYF